MSQSFHNGACEGLAAAREKVRRDTARDKLGPQPGSCGEPLEVAARRHKTERLKGTVETAAQGQLQMLRYLERWWWALILLAAAALFLSIIFGSPPPDIDVPVSSPGDEGGTITIELPPEDLKKLKEWEQQQRLSAIALWTALASLAASIVGLVGKVIDLFGGAKG